MGIFFFRGRYATVNSCYAEHKNDERYFDAYQDPRRLAKVCNASLVSVDGAVDSLVQTNHPAAH